MACFFQSLSANIPCLGNPHYQPASATHTLPTAVKLAYNAKHVVVIPGSGSFGMEACARQFATGKKTIVLRNGYFSYRWTQIFEACGIPTGANGLARPQIIACADTSSLLMRLLFYCTSASPAPYSEASPNTSPAHRSALASSQTTSCSRPSRSIRRRRRTRCSLRPTPLKRCRKGTVF